MSDMPNEIWIDGEPKERRNLCGDFAVCLYRDDCLTKYIRADIAEARIAKLEDALRFYCNENLYAIFTHRTYANERMEVRFKLTDLLGNDQGQRAREALKDEE